MSKQRKEALAAIMDGLDILVGMDKPEEKKEVEREKAPDSFTGLLQSLIPLMIIPQILPLFQQSLGQTLRDTTVNVKVESATSIIPIDITATTAIVPIEIRASQVTLNVNISSQTTVLNVNITGSAVTLSVNVTNAQLDVNLTGSTATLDVNITNQVLLTGQNPPALSFDGINDYVDCGTKDIFKLSSALTIEGWFKFNPDTPGGRGVIQKNPGTSNYDYMLYLSVAGYPSFYLKTPDDTVYDIGYTRNMRDGEWHHWVGTFDGTYMRLYIDGELKAESDTGGVSIRTSNTPLYIFRGWQGYLMGFARNIRMYNRALSAAEVIHNNQNPYSPTTSGLILWLKMDEVAGTTAYDSSGLGNHGTIYGAIWVSSQGAAPTLVNVNIASQIVALNVNIASSAVTLNVNVTNSYLNVNIVSQTTVLNVNITGSVTLNVNVVGDAMVVIKAQQVGLYLGDTWGAIQGRHVDLTGFSWLDPFSEQLVAQFYPNPGEQYLIEGISASYILPKDTNVRPNLIVFRIYTGELTIIDNLVASLNVTREKPTDFINLMRAIPVSSDEPLKIVATSYSPMRVGVQATVYLYKV